MGDVTLRPSATEAIKKRVSGFGFEAFAEVTRHVPEPFAKGDGLITDIGTLGLPKDNRLLVHQKGDILGGLVGRIKGSCTSNQVSKRITTRRGICTLSVGANVTERSRGSGSESGSNKAANGVDNRASPEPQAGRF